MMQLTLWETPQEPAPTDKRTTQEDDVTLIAKMHLSAAVPLAIESLRKHGVTEHDIERAHEQLQTIRAQGGGHAVAFLDPGHTQKEMALLTDVLAVLSYVPGGVRFLGLHFTAEQRTFGIKLDEAFFEALEPFRAAMDQEEMRNSKHPSEVSAQELQRIRELEVLLGRAAESGNEALVAKLEAEMDAILLQPIKSEVA